LIRFHAVPRQSIGEDVNDQNGIARDVTLKSERAGRAPADPIVPTKGEKAVSVAIQASRGLIAAAVPPR
jgi:hypothetical protein